MRLTDSTELRSTIYGTYRCTECDTDHPTFSKAAACHPFIGGVVKVDDEGNEVE